MNLSLDKVIDLSTGLYLGLMSVSTMGLWKNKQTSHSIGGTCHLTGCGKTQMRLALGSGMLAGGLYLYRGFRR